MTGCRFGGGRRVECGFRHDGYGRAGLRFVVDAAIDDRDALQIFLNDFLAHDFDILFRFATGAFAQAVGGMLLHLDPDLLGNVSPGGQLGHSLTDERSFTQIALALSNQELVGVVGGGGLALWPVPVFWRVKLLETLFGMGANVFCGGFRRRSGCAQQQSASHA